MLSSGVGWQVSGERCQGKGVRGKVSGERCQGKGVRGKVSGERQACPELICGAHLRNVESVCMYVYGLCREELIGVAGAQG